MVKIEQPAPLQYLFEGQIEDGISGGISQESSKRNSMIFNDSADDQDIAADNNGSEIPNTETHISNPNNVILNTERQLPSLPNVDNSKEAWFYVIASFVEEMLLWGPLLSTGVYLKYYSASPIFDSATEPQIALIGTIAPFFACKSMIPSMWAGVFLFSISMLIASFVSDIKLLIVFQGVFPGLAAALCAFPIIRWIPEWFDKRKGIATGLIFSGGGVGGVYMPFLYEVFLSKLGYKWSLRIFAISTAVIASMAVAFVKPRVPISSKSNIKRMPMPNFWKTFTSWGFLCVFVSSLLQSFGYFNVALFLPRFSDTLSPSAGAGLLAAFNVCCLISQILWGHITDKMNPTLAMSLSSGLGSVLVLFLWGFNQDYLGIKVLMPFSILFGLITGGFSSMWSQCSYELAGDKGLDKEKQSLLWSGLSVARGIGAILGPTIGSLLYKSPSQLTKFERWGSAGSPQLIALVATSLFGSSLICLLFYVSDKYLKPLIKDKSSTFRSRDNIALNSLDSSRRSSIRQSRGRIGSNLVEMDSRNS